MTLDIHEVPENPIRKEPKHFHFDMRFVGISKGDFKKEESEVYDVKWFDINYIRDIDMFAYYLINKFVRK